MAGEGQDVSPRSKKNQKISLRRNDRDNRKRGTEMRTALNSCGTGEVGESGDDMGAVKLSEVPRQLMGGGGG